MRGVKTLLIVLSMLSLSSARIENGTDSFDKSQLIFAHIIFRHGDRTPIGTYPTDPWKNEWPEGFGQLTKVGIQQQYELGKYFRERYRTLLGNGSYSKDIVYIQSTDFERTLMSAAANLAGLFPPEGDHVWNSDLLWQPIPIHTIPKELDYVLHAETACPRLNYELQKYFASSEFVELNAKHKQLFDYLEENTGISVQNFGDVGFLYDTLWIDELKNKTLPEWSNKVYGPGSDMERVAFCGFQTLTRTSKMARLSTGFLIREIFERCSQKIQSTLLPDRSLWIYSAHDTTIAGVLDSFGLFEPHNPPYASSLLFELYKINDAHYLQVFYRNSTHETLLEFPSCGTKCSIGELLSIYEEIIPSGEFEDECRLPLSIRIFDGAGICGSECFIALICFCILVPLLFIISRRLCLRKKGNITIDSDNMKYL